MSTQKLKRLQSAGWKTGSAKDFLQLSDEEEMLVALRLSLADAVRESRRKRGLSAFPGLGQGLESSLPRRR